MTHAQFKAARVPENDGRGVSAVALAGLWGRWMQYTSPRLRSAALATRPLRPYAHQDEAVFDHMLPQPRLRFLLADEPGTGKTIMTGMYLAEGRRRGLIPGPTVLVVPAHLVQKWQEELEDFFGISPSRLTPEVARDPKDLDPRVEVWITSIDLFTHTADVRRKIAGKRSSWSLAVFDEAHRLTPTSRYLAAAQELASRSHHLLLLTATPHRGKEHFFRGLCHLLDAELYPWDPDEDRYDAALRPSRLSFLRRMKEELKDLNGDDLFPARYAETVSVPLGELELAAYEAVMDYASTWYGKDSTLALSIYGKRAASSLVAAVATLTRRLDALSGSAVRRGNGVVPEGIAEGLRGDRPLSASFEDPEDLQRAEDVIVGAGTRDKQGETEAVIGVLDQLNAAIQLGGTPAKWAKAEELMLKHGITPGNGQWPSRSCKSRAIRIRSFSAASRAISARASASAWLLRTICITPAITSATTGIATGVTSANDSARLTCQDPTATGTSSAATASAVTNGAERAPRRATVSSVRNTHRAKPAARANGISATVSATRSAYQAQNRSLLVRSGSANGVTSQHAANTASSTYPATAAAPGEFCRTEMTT